MDLKNFYLHAVNGNDQKPFDKEKSLSNLEKILQSGYILSRRKMNETLTNENGWNGMDYISICDYSRRNNPPYANRDYFRFYTAYNLFIKNSISIVLRKNGIEAIKPVLMPPTIYDYDSYQRMRALGNHKTKRFSDLPDELQVKDQISLEKSVGITIPIMHLVKDQKGKHYDDEDVIKLIEDTKSLLERYQSTLPIYDLNTQEELDSNEKIKYIIKKQ